MHIVMEQRRLPTPAAIPRVHNITLWTLGYTSEHLIPYYCVEALQSMTHRCKVIT